MSPSGKATDSDSVISKVQILSPQPIFFRPARFVRGGFCFAYSPPINSDGQNLPKKVAKPRRTYLCTYTIIFFFGKSAHILTYKLVICYKGGNLFNFFITKEEYAHFYFRRKTFCIQKRKTMKNRLKAQF